MQIKTLSESIDKKQSLSLIIYGRSGAGKTRLVGTLDGKILILSAERGLLSLDSLDKKDKERISVAELSTAKDIAEIKDIEGFDWIVIDSISDIFESDLAAAKKTIKDPRQAYGELQDTGFALFRFLRDKTKCGLVIIAKEIAEEKRIEPSMPGSKLGQAASYYFDLVCRLVVNLDGTRSLITNSRDGVEVAKDRSGKLNQVEPADLSVLVNKIKGGVATK